MRQTQQNDAQSSLLQSRHMAGIHPSNAKRSRVAHGGRHAPKIWGPKVAIQPVIQVMNKICDRLIEMTPFR